MKKTLLFAFMMSLLTLGGLSACKGSKEEKAVPVAEVSVTPASLALTEGETASLRAAVLPSDAIEYTLTWSSSDAGVATISQDGIVAAIKAGSATITASAGGKSGTCSIVVAAKVIPVEKIELDQTELSLEEGETADLIATVAPSDATDPTVTWSSSDLEVATVSGQGKVTALKAGSAIITAKAGDKTADCKVTVKEKVIPVESISLDYTALELGLDDTFMLTATVLPAHATDASYTWSSSDEDVATISSYGVIYPKKEGVTTITATTADGGKTASCTVTVFNGELRISYETSDHKKLAINESGISGIISHAYGDYGLILCSSSIRTIGEATFANCGTLTEIDLPKSLTEIGSRAFENCASLYAISLPNGLTAIGNGVFAGCSQLSYFNAACTSDDHRSLILDGQLKAFAPAGVSTYTVPSTVTAVAPSAFARCSELTVVTLPSSIDQIGSKAFAECSKLAVVYVMDQTPPVLENADAFSGLPADYVIFVYADVIDDYKAADGWKDVKEHIKAYEPEPKSPRQF